MKSYCELITLPTFMDRFNYLKLNGIAFDKTFGAERYVNQKFYTSYEWRKFRRDIILRDYGCDLGVEGRDILTKIIIHQITIFPFFY